MSTNKNMKINNEHSAKIIRWMLRIINSSVLNMYIMNKSPLFTLFFASVNPHVKWTKKINEAISEFKNETFLFNDKEEKKEFLANFESMNLKNDLSEQQLSDLWVGALLFKKMQEDSTLYKQFEQAISVLTKRYNQYNEEELREIEESRENENNKDNFQNLLMEDQVFRSQIDILHDIKNNEIKTDLSIQIPQYNQIGTFYCHLVFLNTFFKMTCLEREVLEFSYILRQNKIIKEFYNLICDGEYFTETALLTFFGKGKEQEDFEKTIVSGSAFLGNLIEFENQSKKIKEMAEYWYDFFSIPVKDFAALIAKIITPAKTKYHSGSLGNISKPDREIIDHLLQHFNLNNQPTNIMLYSGGRVDKYNLTLKIIKELDLFAYELSEKIPSENLKTACYIAQYFLQYNETNAILIVSKTEKVLSKNKISLRQMLFFDIEVEEEILEQKIEIELMSNPLVKTIWLAVNPKNIHEDSISRLTYSAEVKAASRGERKEMISELLEKFDLTDEFKLKLAQHTHLSYQQLVNAMNLAEKMTFPTMSREQMDQAMTLVFSDPNLLSEAEKKMLEELKQNTKRYTMSNEQKEEIILRAISQSEKALDRKERENLKQSITQYSLEYLNLSGGFNIEQIIKSLTVNPNASLCLYGAAGTGKTQLAEYLAISIDKPIIIKTAGEILDSYVGNTEKNIINMFNEAEETGSLLLLDEGDSFLRNRSFARNSWEVSMVNQLLQSMERFNGTFICATNLFDNLDLAALRRFTFKVEFRAMNPDQRWKMFLTEVDKSEIEKLSEKQREDLRSELDMLYNLTPGDFSVIKKQERLLNEKLSAENWLKQLTFEMDTKNKCVSNNVDNLSNY